MIMIWSLLEKIGFEDRGVRSRKSGNVWPLPNHAFVITCDERACSLKHC
jgi:hypothetical protein